MRKDIQLTALLIIGLALCVRSNGQEKVYRIYDDTSYVKKTIYAHGYDQGEIYFYGKSFKDHLPDGKWYYYETKDSTRRDIQYYLMMEGTFKDSLKDGTFKYYYTKLTQKKDFYLSRIVNYKAGKLHGQYIEYVKSYIHTRIKNIVKEVHYKYFEANYYEGKLHGFMIGYCLNLNDRKIYPRWIQLYDQGELKAWVIYKMVKWKRWGGMDRFIVTDTIEAFGIGEKIPSYLEGEFY